MNSERLQFFLHRQGVYLNIIVMLFQYKDAQYTTITSPSCDGMLCTQDSQLINENYEVVTWISLIKLGNVN